MRIYVLSYLLIIMICKFVNYHLNLSQANAYEHYTRLHHLIN